MPVESWFTWARRVVSLEPGTQTSTGSIYLLVECLYWDILRDWKTAPRRDCRRRPSCTSRVWCSAFRICLRWCNWEWSLWLLPLQHWTSFHDSLLSIGGRVRATISVRTCVDAGADNTRVERNKFQVLLCLPTAPVLLLIYNGGFGTSPIYGHHRQAAACLCGSIWGAGRKAQ